MKINETEGVLRTITIDLDYRIGSQHHPNPIWMGKLPNVNNFHSLNDNIIVDHEKIIISNL